MVAGTPGQLRFKFSDLIKEIQALKAITGEFIDARSIRSLDSLSTQLDGMWDAAPGREYEWTLADVWTSESEGEYEPGDRKGALRIAACISGTWHVRPLGQNSNKDRPKRELEFVGLASTRVRIFETTGERRQLAMWRMELGDARSPGCFFHVQVLGEAEAPPFPKALSVPRLPTVFVTPMSVFEYVLGEVFQKRWAMAASESGGDWHVWNGIQKRRLARLLIWQMRVIETALGSPWTTFKAARPDAGLFLG